MAYLGRGRKEDLKLLATELGLQVTDSLKVIQLRELITKSATYDEEFTKNMLTNIIDDRVASEKEAERLKLFEEKAAEDRAVKEAEERRLANERCFELEKLKLQLEVNKNKPGESVTQEVDQPKFELNRILPKFNPKDDEIGLYLTVFERQLKFVNIPETNWVPYLIGSLPPEINQLVVRESEEDSKDYTKVKEMLLKRYRLTADRFRQLFSHHKKCAEITWKDFAFELKSYFEGWIKELNISNFEQLQELIIADQIKKRTPPDVKEHFVDIWSELNNPLELAEKLDYYENVRQGMKKTAPLIAKKTPFKENAKFNPERKFKSPNPRDINQIKNTNFDNSIFTNSRQEKKSIYCYGCGYPGFIQSKCPKCNKLTGETKTVVNYVKLYAVESSDLLSSSISLKVCGERAAFCADTGASNSIAGERFYKLLKDRGFKFNERNITLVLADGKEKDVKALTTVVNLHLEGKIVRMKFIALPEAKGNRTLLGTDFLQAAGVVLNIQRGTWHFSEKPWKQYSFYKEPSEAQETSKVVVSQGNTAPEITESSDTPDSMTSDFVKLRDDEGKHLTIEQRNKLNSLLEEFKTSFQPGGDPTPYVEHRIQTGNSLPVAQPPYRLTPAKKELLKKELDSLLAQGIIEECESPYASPVVLVYKPDGSLRLCIDYRKLNSTTIPDTYPLPRMDDLLNEAKSTKYMSTIDLRAGYHQVKVYEADQEKTAFICPFGTYKYLRMPFGLRNAPATFQRLIDRFRSGLKDVFLLSYLDDIIILSETFEKHLEDLREVFKRLCSFKLNANRRKCRFACDRVKYLGHWITEKGVEVDADKVSSIQKIPSPTCVKEVQSFLQTCSWFRRYVPNFSEVAKPLSDLTKKNKQWTWGETEQKSFEELKRRLISAPVLSQPDGSKPFLIKTDASNYALGAVLIQGEGPEEHVIEYASRLLNSAERNYSTTEREALAVVWALEKFRGYVEGQEIIIASDHQPLKWLMSIKSPSGRLARWALQIQSYHPKILYTPGKSNVIADLLSRPAYANNDFVCNLNAISIDLPSRKSKDIRDEQLKDNDIRKIIDCFESGKKDENYVNWTSRGYIMNQGILYRYSPETESEEAQLVVPCQERERVLQQYHDIPTAGHYGAEGTYHKISSRYYFPGMRKFISEYVKNCAECNRYKPNNQKPVGLLRTPVYAQRFETLAIDLFGPLPETLSGKKWIFIVEDTSTKWVELFALEDATASNCAKVLIEEVFLRFGIPRRLISDNGPQFISAVMQQTCHFLGIKQDVTPFYHPQANPSERKNRDLKPRLAILVGDAHDTWEEKLPMIRFSMNTAKCDTTGHTAAYLQFGRELRTTDDINHDLRALIDNDNFVAEITPYLKEFARLTPQIRERVEQKQDQRKEYFDKRRRQIYYQPGDKVWITLHPVSKSMNKKSKKFMPKREGPYIIMTNRSPTTYEIADPATPDEVLGTYHTNMLRPYDLSPLKDPGPVAPLKKRGRPRKADPPKRPLRRDVVRARGGVCNQICKASSSTALLADNPDIYKQRTPQLDSSAFDSYE